MGVLIIAALATVATILFLLTPLVAAGGRQGLKGWALLILLTVSAMGLYLWRGAPDTPSEPALFDHSSPRAVQRQLLKKELTLAEQLKINPDDTALMLALGEARLAGGRLDGAIEILGTAHARQPEDNDINLKLGAAHYAAALAALLLENDKAKAQIHFAAALKVVPENASYREKLEADFLKFEEDVE